MQYTKTTIEIIPSHLYWISDKNAPTKAKIHIICTDDSLTYVPYNTDFGPLDISQIVTYCKNLNSLLSGPNRQKLPIYHYTSVVPAKRANSALLVCAYQVLVLKKSPNEAWEPFEQASRFLPFRDASAQPNRFELLIIDCLNAISKALSYNWLDIDSFDVDEYQKCSLPENGSFNWIVPEKIIAFPCPSDKLAHGLIVEEFCRLFECCGVTAVVRIYQPTYDGVRFKKQGIRHFDLEEAGDSLPNEDSIQNFIEICRREKVVAVHCLNGLGKSVTLIGCYTIKHYNLTGKEFIAWARMCRPGCILGKQQQFLCNFYENLSNIRRNSRPNSMIKMEFEKHLSPDITTRKYSISVANGYNSVKGMRQPVKYKTRFNQLVKIDPEMMKLYGKKQSEEDVS